MSLKLKNLDRNSLPQALLPLAKQQMNVLFTDDDNLITSMISRAIDLFEKKSDLRIFKASAEWKPYPESFPVPVPMQPLTGTLTAMDDGTDVSADYEIDGDVGDGRFHPLWLVYTGDTSSEVPLIASPTLTITVQVGYAAPDDMSPGILDIILRVASFLYANREIAGDVAAAMPLMLDDYLVGNWVPRA